MKKLQHHARLLFGSLIAAMTLVAISVAQFSSPESTFDLSWHTIDGGGGTSTGASFELSGTIGQPDAGVMAGGGFELAGGFWPGSKGPITPTCPADIAPPGGDGVVNVNDLLAVINSWGPCPTLPNPCPADIAPAGGDGAVNVNDLLAVINAWGVCP
jgi:hypothetical protein